MTDYHQREISSLVREALGTLPVVVLTGLRQAGKTTFLLRDEAVRERRYFTLDDFATLEAARREPEALITGDEPVTIDEVQRSPELLLAVKKEVDRRRTPGRFLLSGSANPIWRSSRVSAIPSPGGRSTSPCIPFLAAS